MNIFISLLLSAYISKCAQDNLVHLKYYLKPKSLEKEQPCCLYKDLNIYDKEISSIAKKSIQVKVSEKDYPVKAQLKKDICIGCHKVANEIYNATKMLENSLSIKDSKDIGHNFSIFLKSGTISSATKYVACLINRNRNKIASAYIIISQKKNHEDQQLSGSNYKFLEIVENPMSEGEFTRSSNIFTLRELMKRDSYHNFRIEYVSCYKNAPLYPEEKPFLDRFSGQFKLSELNELIKHSEEYLMWFKSRKARIQAKYGLPDKNETVEAPKRTQRPGLKILIYISTLLLVVFLIIIGLLCYSFN
jgi:hypothetical protein